MFCELFIVLCQVCLLSSGPNKATTTTTASLPQEGSLSRVLHAVCHPQPEHANSVFLSAMVYLHFTVSPYLLLDILALICGLLILVFVTWIFCSRKTIARLEAKMKTRTRILRCYAKFVSRAFRAQDLLMAKLIFDATAAKAKERLFVKELDAKALLVRRLIYEAAASKGIELTLRKELDAKAHLVRRLIYEAAASKGMELTLRKKYEFELDKMAHPIANLESSDFYVVSKDNDSPPLQEVTPEDSGTVAVLRDIFAFQCQNDHLVKRLLQDLDNTRCANDELREQLHLLEQDRFVEEDNELIISRLFKDAQALREELVKKDQVISGLYDDWERSEEQFCTERYKAHTLSRHLSQACQSLEYLTEQSQSRLQEKDEYIASLQSKLCKALEEQDSFKQTEQNLVDAQIQAQSPDTALTARQALIADLASGRLISTSDSCDMGSLVLEKDVEEMAAKFELHDLSVASYLPENSQSLGSIVDTLQLKDLSARLGDLTELSVPSYLLEDSMDMGSGTPVNLLGPQVPVDTPKEPGTCHSDLFVLAEQSFREDESSLVVETSSYAELLPAVIQALQGPPAVHKRVLALRQAEGPNSPTFSSVPVAPTKMPFVLSFDAPSRPTSSIAQKENKPVASC